MKLAIRHHDETPVVRPRAVEAAPLPCKPGTSRAVLDELLAEAAEPTPAEQIRRALTAATAGLAALLNEPAPRTDWAAVLATIDMVPLDAVRVRETFAAEDELLDGAK